MLAAITAALMMLYAAATAPVEDMVRRIHDVAGGLLSLDRQMVGRLMRTVVPDILYLEYKSLYLEVKAFRAARVDARPTGAAVAGRAAMERRPYQGRGATGCDRRQDGGSPCGRLAEDGSPHHAAVTSAAAPVAAPPQARASVVEGFTAADRKMLEQIYRASVYGETPTAAQVVGDVRRRQIAYGVNLYKPSSRYVKGVSSYVAARQAVRQFEDAEGAYSSDEIASLAKAIRREYQKPVNSPRT